MYVVFYSKDLGLIGLVGSTNTELFYRLKMCTHFFSARVYLNPKGVLLVYVTFLCYDLFSGLKLKTSPFHFDIDCS